MTEVTILMNSISTVLHNHGERFLQADALKEATDQSCLPPPRNTCGPQEAVDTRNAFEKSVDSLKELGQAFVQSAEDRYQKRYDSVGGFLDY